MVRIDAAMLQTEYRTQEPYWEFPLQRVFEQQALFQKVKEPCDKVEKQENILSSMLCERLIPLTRDRFIQTDYICKSMHFSECLPRT